MKHRKLFWTFIIAAICAAAFIPVRLSVKVNDKVTHSYDKMTNDDLSVRAITLVQLSWPVNDFKISSDSKEEYNDAVVKWAYLTGRVHVSRMPAGSIAAVYTDTDAKYGDAFRPSCVKVKVRFINGYEKEVDSPEYTVPEKIDENEVTVISTDYGNTILQYDIETPVAVTASYDGSLYEGDELDADKVHTAAVYPDGSSVEINCRVNLTENHAKAGNIGTAYTCYGSTEIDVDAVRITGARSSGLYHAGDSPDAGDVTLVYSDGTEREADSDGVDFSIAENAGADDSESGSGYERTGMKLQEGLNEIPFAYFGREHTLYINAAGYTRAGRAAIENTEELEAAVYSHTDSDVYAAVRRITGGGTRYYLAHIIVSDPARLFPENPEPDNTVVWAGIRNAYEPFVTVRNGVSEGTVLTTGHEICFTREGAVFSPGAGYDSKALVDNDVAYSFGTDAPVLINDGNKTNEGNSNGMGREVRNCIGMVSPGEYYLLVCDGGLTYREMQNVMSETGCSYARPFSEGVSFSFEGKLLCGTDSDTDGAFCAAG